MRSVAITLFDSSSNANKALLATLKQEYSEGRSPLGQPSLLMSQVATAITAMEGRLKAIQKSGERPLTDKEELALRLNRQYPQDVGVLSAFFLNLVKLQAGQARPIVLSRESSLCCLLAPAREQTQ